MTTGSLMKVESIAECSLWGILQYFRPSLSDYLSLKRFTQVLLYCDEIRKGHLNYRESEFKKTLSWDTVGYAKGKHHTELM